MPCGDPNREPVARLPHNVGKRKRPRIRKPRPWKVPRPKWIGPPADEVRCELFHGGGLQITVAIS